MSDAPADLRAALAERYDLHRVLGRGGMATVYLAADRKHQREVAIKVLRPDLAASLGSDRFLKEIQIAARLSHPHILALHDSGEAAGFLYYVMPYVEGASLRQRLERDRRLDVETALAIAVPVADALGYAHRMGVFHRDIKPENILFQQGHPIVGDFGIAKAIVTAGGMNLTRTGFPVGTPGYMSPEQAAGLTDLDERTDVYSLAVVVYEMIVGETPGRWPTEDAVRAGRFLEAPAAHREQLARNGAAVEGALVRGMSIRHDQRTAAPAVLIDELLGRRLAPALAPARVSAPTPEPEAPRRQYSDEEVRAIVARAAELEASKPTLGGALTIGGVQALAGEVGIAPEIVQEAAQSMARPSTPTPAYYGREPNKRGFWTGGPSVIEFERVVEGELPDQDFPMLVEEIRAAVKNTGQVSQFGRSFSWISTRGASGGGRDVQVTVTVRSGWTRITVREDLALYVGQIFGGIGGGVGGGGIGLVMGILAGALKMPEAAIVAVPLWVAGSLSASRSIYHYGTKRRTRALELLADRLQVLTRESIPVRRLAR